jgi:hypothetical protein
MAYNHSPESGFMFGKRGRPKGSIADKRRGELIQVKVYTDEKESYEKAAREDGLTMAAWIRQKLNRAVRGTSTE